MADFNRETFERKLNRLSETQESIESLSSWVVQQVKFSKLIAESWIRVFNAGRAHRYQTLLYLVNDVLQNGRRKGGLDFSIAFREVLPQALVIAHGQKCQPIIERIIGVWDERRVYDSAFLRYLRQCLENGAEFLLSNPPSDVTTTTVEMSSASVTERLETFSNFEATLASKLVKLNSTRLHSWNDSMLTAIKDKQEGQQIYEEFEEAVMCLKDCCETMTSEVEHRRNIIAALEQSLVEQRQETSLTKKLYKEVSSIDSKIRSKLSLLRSNLNSLPKAPQQEMVQSVVNPPPQLAVNPPPQLGVNPPPQLGVKTIPDLSTLLPPIQTAASFLPHPSLKLETQEGVVNETQQGKGETTMDAERVDHIEEEDMDIDNSASEDESQPAKVARTDGMPIAGQEIAKMNGPLVGVNTTGSQGNGGQINESVGQPMSGNAMPANGVMTNRMPIDGINPLSFHPPQTTNPPPSENHLPNTGRHPPILQTPTTPPMFSPSLLVHPSFVHPMAQNFPMPMAAPRQPVHPVGVVNPMMARLPPHIPPQRYDHPRYPYNHRFPGASRGRGHGPYQTQPVPSRF